MWPKDDCWHLPVLLLYGFQWVVTFGNQLSMFCVTELQCIWGHLLNKRTLPELQYYCGLKKLHDQKYSGLQDSAHVSINCSSITDAEELWVCLMYNVQFQTCMEM